MPRPDPARSENHHKRAVDHDQQLAALRMRLHETAQQVRTAEDWARYLRAAARLHGQTWPNILLIASRIPEGHRGLRQQTPAGSKPR